MPSLGEHLNQYQCLDDDDDAYDDRISSITEQMRLYQYQCLDDDSDMREEIPIKGSSVSSDQPRSSIRDRIDVPKSIDPATGPTRESGPVVVHCDNARSPAMKYTGVYCPSSRRDVSGFQKCGYERNADMTRAFLKQMRGNIRKIENRRCCFQLCGNSKGHWLMGLLNKNDEKHHWYLLCESGDQYVELFTPRARDTKFWHDPEQFLFLDEVHSRWFPIGGSKANMVSLAITPLETVEKALSLDLSTRRNFVPTNYQKASDFSAWDRNFVLHTDPRTCRLPLNWIDSFMGVYKPVHGKVMGGYPVWERQNHLTTTLVNSMSDPVKRYLENQGIRLMLPGNKKQFLYVDKDDQDSGHSFVFAATSMKNIADMRARRKHPSFVGNCVPRDIDSLLSDPTSLFASPEKAFATWSACYFGKWERLHVAFTPEDYFKEAMALAALEVDDAPVHEEKVTSSDPTKKKKNKKKKKKAASRKKDNKTMAENQESKEDSPTTLCDAHVKTGASDLENQNKRGKAHDVLRHLATLLDVTSSKIPSCATKHPIADSASDPEIQEWDTEKTVHFLLDTTEELEAAWTSVSDSISSPILEAALSSTECSKWIKGNASRLVILFSKKKRQEDLTVLLNAGGVNVSAKALSALFSSLPKERGDPFNNKIANIICSKCCITMESKDDFKLAKDAVFDRVGKAGKKVMMKALKQASAKVRKPKGNLPKDNNSDAGALAVKNRDESEAEVEAGSGARADGAGGGTDIVLLEQPDFRKAAESALKWYIEELDKLLIKAAVKDDCVDADEDKAIELHTNEKRKESTGGTSIKKQNNLLTAEQVVAALSNCETEDALADVETGIDLFQWDNISEWTVDITEQAHKWFNKHKKKDRVLCERIILRLILLSTGRWPYVLCKPLKSKSKSIRLYETKIDKASRIIWEVAIAFSPRRSSLDQSYCEQVIRVWDVVLDHDNLARAIDLTVERIYKSHMRGQECALYAEIDKANSSISSTKDVIGDVRIPRVFPMSQEVICVGSTREQTPKGRSWHFHPASEDDRQFTLLKFYELNAGAVKILLDGQDESMDLPFTPGPKEHEIIHFQSDPQRSILLMGRSGTGKTTCLVFRMWAQYAQYMDGQQGSQPHQLFLTKNDVLCREVERSFDNMGLAWRRRIGTNSHSKDPGNKHAGEEEPTNKMRQHINERENLTKFFTTSELLDALEVDLPGEHFFTSHELEQRVDSRKQKDSVTKGVEDLLSGGAEKEKETSTSRSELTFSIFRKLWRKIRSGSGSQMDSALVWREIKSFIKGSVAALQLNHEERSLPKNRFLSLDEYLSLPRKQSRMDESQRREVYDLFLSYEKLKKEGSYYDECDLVYNIAGRISHLEQMTSEDSSLLQIDSLFVDEVQDFTQAELYILAKLCRDPNNLFLAGDTAQSIAVGVDFRFTDLRQIFYDHFGGIEPKLLQLSHNYRSHAGVLRLAACVVELLYHFFSNSLDKLPPDLGLFDGPKPVIMDVSSPTDLVLMLEGAKRETSRIEFGAHQVVIVSSEDAKKNLPDEFSIDHDWVMTVQQSKGLEFDDVLLYNFFSDSPAKDLWRVVSNYTEEDIAAYYADATVAASGVQKYDWQSPMLAETRHLAFSLDQHKILETELKKLYTAITRARVNVFIAETNADQSRPMFNYFRKRCVVDAVNKDMSEGLSGVRVFGVNDNIEDWRNRGEYYLKNAEGDRIGGCLRLAAKCFDRAQDDERKKIALAFLAFTEIEEDNHKKKGKQGAERKEKLYSITAQLLEARDVGFLNKAALCLLRTGVHDEDAAKMFELYARLRYTSRMCDEKGRVPLPMAPSLHEKKYFSYAGKLFARCSQRNGNTGLALASFRTFLCSNNYDDAHLLLSSGMLPLHDGQTFIQLHKLCVPSNENKRDPIAYFQDSFELSGECGSLRESIKIAASIGCRKLFKSDGPGFFAALQLIPLRSDRIKLLGGVDESDAGLSLSKKPWASHYLFRKEKVASEKMVVDLVDMLVSELDAEKRYNEAAETLENRGFLLEAADRYDQLSKEEGSRFLASKATGLRVRWVELMILADRWKDDRESLLALLAKATLKSKNNNDIPLDVRYSAFLSQAVLNDCLSDLFEVITECKASVMWQCRSLKLFLDLSSKEKLFDDLPGRNISNRLNFVHSIAKRMKELAVALRRQTSVRSPAENLIITSAEGFFDLEPQRLDRTRLETNPIVNLRLREVLHSEKCSLPTLSIGNSLLRGFTQVVDPDKIHSILSRHIYKECASLLMALDDLVRVQEQNSRPSNGHYFSPTCMQEYVDCLQMHMSCVQSMSTLCHGGTTNKGPWISVKKRISEGTQSSLKYLLDILLSKTQLLFTIDSNSSDSANAIVLKQEAINALKSFVTARFKKLPMQDKKKDIKHAVVFWRLLSFCSGNGSYASGELRREILRMERNKQTEIEFQRKRWQYFINKSKKELYPRLWLWAVESASEEIFNSISVVERMIHTSYRDGLTSLTKFDQVSLLEVNSVAIFGSLSLRYNEVDSPPMLILNHFYLHNILGGDGCLQGFGVPLKSAILTYCHKRFDIVFEKCVIHLENTIGIILDNGLLSAVGEGEAIERFEMALHLSIFICCNAIAFSSVGKDMDTLEYKRDLSVLPSLPLQGNVRKLVAELRKTFAEKLWPSHLNIFLAKQPNTFMDLAKISDSLLRLSRSTRDSYVLCKLHQDKEDKVRFRCWEQLDDVSCILAKISFDDCNIFKNWDTKNTTFLDEVDSVDPNCDDLTHGRKSEELNATRVIFQFIESKMGARANVEVDEAIIHFQHWKAVMCAFIRRVRIVVGEKILSLQENNDSTLGDEGEVMVCIFEKIANPFQDAQIFYQQKQNTMLDFNNAIVDAAECTYCSWVFDMNVQAERFKQWDMEGRRMPFPEFVRNLNRGLYGIENTSCGELIYHVRTLMHQDNAMKYNKQLEDFATVFARMRMGLSLLHNVISICDEEGQRGNNISSWYLHTAEEGRELASRLDKALRDLGSAGLIWSRQPKHEYAWTLLQGTYILPDEAECFFMKKRDDEARLKERDASEKNSQDNHGNEGAAGSILNPGAAAFIPQFLL